MSYAQTMDIHKIRLKWIGVNQKNGILGKRILETQRQDDEIIRTPKQALKQVPPWMKKIWRYNSWTSEELTHIIKKLEANDLSIVGDGSVRDQWGALAWNMVEKSNFKKICSLVHPVDGNPNNMKEIRAEATCLLSSLSLLHTLQQFVTNESTSVKIYTRCVGLINRINLNHINTPSNVLSDHIDIIYQIRTMIKEIKFKLEIIHTVKPTEDDLETATDPEQELFKVHQTALNYYHSDNYRPPNQFPILFPSQKIYITYNNKPIVTNIARFLQETEQKVLREEYFFERMDIHPNSLQQIDQYALGRVFQKNKSGAAMYTKIVHNQLNTMMVNKKWNMGSDICPLCNSAKEDWLHILKCTAPAPSIHRDLCLAEFEEKMRLHRTYPPLAELFYEVLANPGSIPELPVVANPNFILLFEKAFQSQSMIGWNNFIRGFISKKWKAVQYAYVRKLKRRDIHAVDKWARMIIKTIIEFTRSMWKIRCGIVSDEKKATYEQRQRMDIYRLFKYLLSHPDEVPPNANHYLEKDESFFFKTSLDNVLMWKRGLEVGLEDTNTHKKTTLKQYYRRQRPVAPKKRKTTTGKDKPKQKTKKKKKKKTKSQSSLTLHFTTVEEPTAESPPSPDQIPIVPATRKRNPKRKISLSTTMTNYKQRIQEFYANKCDQDNTISRGFKRHNQVSPTTIRDSVENLPRPRKRICHRNNKSFLPGQN